MVSELNKLLGWGVLKFFHVKLKAEAIEISDLPIFFFEKIREVIQIIADFELFIDNCIKRTIPPFFIFVIKLISKLS